MPDRQQARKKRATILVHPNGTRDGLYPPSTGIIADVRLENFLFNDKFAIKFADFGESSLMPVDWDLTGSDELGFSTITDMGQLGAVMYHIVTGQECKFDIWDGREKPTWPQRDELPSTSGVWLGHVIEKCWTHGFNSADDLAHELENLANKHPMRPFAEC